ncbi:uncharacterized protein B0I36DRAFT_316229 [Microdochium trichocladiopsis]|uniref:Uncharacterized protein n=1 Tax=Microdochium trichocladiopsis TaxID=1682393 RepID=A0A9P8YCV0_9PEZI|nr:uncharacterized protein B0I36DRAFT_316189 [Microdochium trichocladiopsis]XP_046017540.1 uncharacterized protein B0I36DRAFT_316194 [Microdochium trichocladiopsis]XP_046017546.1 uncharacterized protein B0I36DRAFT_316212 [Microdochium trichocladiopsis]XP_046017552.1 uncharacterized protein B0I36DRAFT_316229 [Microdochium trichocladiopsis]KAH7038418.1 hypothetical protein B0I36DRAFT_316189 [Microdochium trichocladiopsis]KAH7038419.1 hypothetical protein B0I36DRAFT_316194 [Microdochium trichocla
MKVQQPPGGIVFSPQQGPCQERRGTHQRSIQAPICDYTTQHSRIRQSIPPLTKDATAVRNLIADTTRHAASSAELIRPTTSPVPRRTTLLHDVEQTPDTLHQSRSRWLTNPRPDHLRRKRGRDEASEDDILLAPKPSQVFKQRLRVVPIPVASALALTRSTQRRKTAYPSLRILTYCPHVLPTVPVQAQPPRSVHHQSNNIAARQLKNTLPTGFSPQTTTQPNMELRRKSAHSAREHPLQLPQHVRTHILPRCTQSFQHLHRTTDVGAPPGSHSRLQNLSALLRLRAQRPTLVYSLPLHVEKIRAQALRTPVLPHPVLPRCFVLCPRK